ncbi:ParB/RepB/Spo0J family partition protein [Pseudomonas sp. NPDC098747]|uniref:ParB/RepB/Spo0J family partition protein n=1 Tax=Pseudomonas sp. NPDC098747 TaxID=3364487 RepID=UPI00383B0897
MAVKFSLEKLVGDKIIIRARTGLQVAYNKLVPIWNARDHDGDWEEKINDLVNHLRNGGIVPAVEVHINESSGNIEIVEGYRRHEAYGRLIAEGLPVDLINIVQFKGGPEARIARIITSNNQVELRPLEKAEVYKQLESLNVGVDRIAEIVNKSRTHVADYLLLAYASESVRSLVRSNAVGADTAIKTIREHGERAATVLEESLQKRGGKKVTMGSIKGKSLPSKITSAVITELDNFESSLPQAVHTHLYKIAKARAEKGIADEDETEMVEVPAKALRKILDVHGDMEAARFKQAEKQRLREAQAAQGELGGGGSHG